MANIDSVGARLNPADEIVVAANKDGEIISAINMVNGVEYIGGGDFSEAKLVIINNTSELDANAPFIDDSSAGYFDRIYRGTSTVNIILYKNTAFFYVSAFDTFEFILDGNIAPRFSDDPDYPEFIITGDATLTINSK